MIIVAAVVALAAAQEASPTTADLETAYISWTHCLGARERIADPETPVRRAARAVRGACEPLQRELIAAHSAWLAQASRSDRERARARRDLSRLIDDVRANVLVRLREMRRD